MQNLLIIDNNILNIQKLINNISHSITNLKLYGFYINKDENIYKDIEKNNIDIIVLNIDTFQTDLIKYIYQNKLEYYKKSIIILYNDINQLKTSQIQQYNKYIFKCLKKSNNLEPLLKILRLLTYIKENNYDELVIEIKIERILDNIGFKTTHTGTKYIIEAVKLFYINNIEKFKLNNIFNFLGKKYNKSPNTIKGDIREATKYMYKHINKNFVLDFFNYIELIEFPTVSEIISTILEKM